ncbi:ATP/GTP-binding protein [Pontibacterium granulatum]|uniref:GTP-binding protein n=1 Tax=Pontibacterium granulatum TaxID=2036029 RepID=UPI00249A437F|nr:ATP/GTP-binding protein [Pontibacterium granulatum]MDI3326162.1 ATP/GTP-binding protein [Pontibacterium granulatum]
MENHKVLFIGPVGSGKTTAIRSISDIDCLDTEAQVSDVTGRRKQTTTVAMDYGRLTLSEESRVHLYGTPGQARFRFMWELLSEEIAKDCAGVVMMIDNTRNYPMRDLKYYAREFANVIDNKRLVIAVTRSDLRMRPSVEEYHGLLKELGKEAAVCFIDGRRKSDLLSLVELILEGQCDYSEWATLKRLAEAEQKDMEFSSNGAELEIDEYQGEQVVIKESVVNGLLNIEGVLGLAATDANGDLVTSSLEGSQLENFIALVTGIVPDQGENSSLGQVNNVVFRDRHENNLSVFVWEGMALGVVSSRKTSTRMIRQQVNDLLQWG